MSSRQNHMSILTAAISFATIEAEQRVLGGPQKKRGARCGGNPRKIARNVERLQRCVVPDDHAESFFRPRRRCAVKRSCFVRKMTTALVKKQQQKSSKRATKFHRSSEGTRLKHRLCGRHSVGRPRDCEALVRSTDSDSGLSLSVGQGLGWEQVRVKPVRDKNQNTQRQ